MRQERILKWLDLLEELVISLVPTQRDQAELTRHFWRFKRALGRWLDESEVEAESRQKRVVVIENDRQAE
ncbi:MAG TPA: hypothetical protein VJB98_03325 [Candidatus Paceibacterota bacterium]